MGNLKKLQIDGVDIQPVVSEYDTYDSDGNSISNKYANKNTVNSQMVNIANQISELSNSANALHTKLGDGNGLNTPHKDVAANIVNDIYAARDNMKQSIVTALSAKGVSASTSETIESLISKIGTIEVGSDIPEWYVPTNNYSNTWIATATGTKPDNYSYVVGRCCAVDSNNNNIYFIGGDCYTSLEFDGGNTSTAVVTCYNANTNQWSTKRAYSFPISFAGAAYYNGYIYVCGGYENWDEISYQHYRYSITGNSWTTRATMSYSGIGHAYTPIGNTLYAIGGSEDLCMSYSTQFNSWTTISYYPSIDYDILLNPVAGAANNTLYVADPLTQVLFAYSTTSKTWSESTVGTPFSSYDEMGQYSGGMLNNKLHIVFVGQATKYHQCYDISTGTWTSKSTSTIALGCAGGSGVANGNLYTLTLDSKLYCYIP